MNDFENHIKNKTVALVGPADYLEFLDTNKNLTLINSADVVIKMNRGFDLSEKYFHLIGDRVDIFYNSLKEDCVNGGILDVEKIVKANVKHIRTYPQSDMKGIALSNLSNAKNEKTLKKIQSLHSRGVTSSMIDCNFFTEISLKVDCRPTTGFIAIYDILNARPSKLYITGFNFFLGSPLKGYWGGSEPGGIEELWGLSEKEHADKVHASTRHVHKNMWKVFKTEIVPLEFVSMDPIMQEIFLLEEYNKKEYDQILERYKC